MSRLENVDCLEQQLAELQLARDISSPNKMKKVPPAVPPKKKAQPQIPHSAIVSTIREPSYSTKLPATVLNNNIPYSNSLSGSLHPSNKDYTNLIHMNTSTTANQKLKYNVQMPLKNYNNTTYSNISPHQNNNNDLPPPPPPPPSCVKLSSPKQLNISQNNEEYLPPPSPVSSNYSELVRATTNMNYNPERPAYPPIYQNEFNEYGLSQASTYESLYEPITPHSASNVTSLGSHVISKQRKNMDNLSLSSNQPPLHKEEEVDALTNLLVKSMTDSQDLDVFGICVKCDGKVIGENSGCTAMGNLYHVKCFCCNQCNVNLQGKPFYAVEDQPYCEVDYYETLEKCCVCTKPILDRILRATGKPYHPTCFTCVECGKSLDGIPFTVDAMNQIHCIEDFHKKFAPRCCVCELPIMPENGEEETVRVVALDRSFHVRCYRCEDCGLLLSSEAEGRGCYPLDDHILCRTCNAHRIRHLTNVMTTDL